MPPLQGIFAQAPAAAPLATTANGLLVGTPDLDTAEGYWSSLSEPLDGVAHI